MLSPPGATCRRRAGPAPVAALRSDLKAFFAASRRFFFDGDPRQAEAGLPGRALVLLARRLAAIERAGAS
ncbi:MAG: hypothetical protein CMP81_11985 [Fulvimarina sp.]|nr:hypothetical protein [Fulvimarina sp.]